MTHRCRDWKISTKNYVFVTRTTLVVLALKKRRDVTKNFACHVHICKFRVKYLQSAYDVQGWIANRNEVVWRRSEKGVRAVMSDAWHALRSVNSSLCRVCSVSSGADACPLPFRPPFPPLVSSYPRRNRETSKLHARKAESSATCSTVAWLPRHRSHEIAAKYCPSFYSVPRSKRGGRGGLISSSEIGLKRDDSLSESDGFGLLEISLLHVG